MTQAFNLAQLANNLNTSGQLDATDGLSGLVATANLATGSASSSTYLRGDQTWATISQVVKKIYTYSYSTRNSPSNAVQNVFSWTTSFTPIDKTNNSFLVISAVPIQSQTQDYSGFGLRFEQNSGGGILDTQGVGTQYADLSAQSLTMSVQQYAFNIAPNQLPSGTLTIYHRLYTADSQATICPNSSDNSRINQTSAQLFIIEYAA